MSDCWGDVSPSRLMETIVILWTLSEAPGALNVRSARYVPSEAGRTRQLSFEREKCLVEILAFLSGTSDDPSKVVAACVEEGFAEDSLTIRFATNSGDGTDISSGLERIARTLEKASRRGQTRDMDSHDLLQEIIRMDFWRILSRLRSTHAKKSRKTIGKPVLMTQLSQAVNRDMRKMCPRLSRERVSALRKKVEILHNLSSTLEAFSTVDFGFDKVQIVLMQILKCASEMAHEGTLPILLEAAWELNPEVKVHLVSAIRKLGRYYNASQDLISAARTTRYSIFDTVHVEQYQLDISSTQTLLPTSTSPTLESSINELISRESKLKDQVSSSSVRSYLGKLYLAKSKDFRFRTNSSRSSWKVHAEIQLLFFHEINRVDLPPRVICASKSPCYLCYQFLSLHGRYHVPDTHGRLYPGWILPTWLGQISDERREALGQIINALHRVLVLRIQQLVTTKRTSVGPPNESVIWSTANWSASTVPLQTTEKTSIIPTTLHKSSEWSNTLVENTEAYKVSTKHQGSPSSSSQNELLQPSADAEELLYQGFASQVDSSAESPHFPCVGATVDICLGAGEKEIRIRTEHIHLTVSREAPCNGDAPQEYWVHCKLIDKSELRRLFSDSEPVDVMGMLPGSEMVLKEGSLQVSTHLLLAVCDEVLSISYGSSKPI